MFPDLADSLAVARAIENNAAELLLAMGRAGGGEEYQDAGLHWTIGGSPIDYHNAVVHADLTQATSTPDAVILSVIGKLRAHRVPGSWHIGPSTRPADLGVRLVEHGFEHASDEPGMAVDLTVLNEAITTPANLIIERVRDAAQLDTWASTLAQGFGEGEREANWVRDTYRTIGLGDETPFRHYLASLDGEAVATATLYGAAGVVGLYFIMTTPKARRQGIGAAVTLAALQDARTMGYRVGVLCASQAGAPLYERIGFATFCHIGIYEWALR